jgi:DnaJ-class molecular chaperone
MAKDYYRILEISRDATSLEIKKTYRRLALQYHPDRNADDSAIEHFKEITEAYGVDSPSTGRRCSKISCPNQSSGMFSMICPYAKNGLTAY